MRTHISRLLLLAALSVCLWCTACGTSEKNSNTSGAVDTPGEVDIPVEVNTPAEVDTSGEVDTPVEVNTPVEMNTPIEVDISVNVTVRVNAFADAPEATTVTIFVGNEKQTYQAVAAQSSIDLGDIEVGTTVRANVISNAGISKVDILVDNCFRGSDICGSTGCSANAETVITDQVCLNQGAQGM